jgi:hypothetical protein
MSEEERRSSLASTMVALITTEPTDQVLAGGGQPQGKLQVAVSRPIVEGHEQPLPSLEPDTIDNMAQLTTYNLVVMVGGSYRMEVRKGLVYLD